MSQKKPQKMPQKMPQKAPQKIKTDRKHVQRREKHCVVMLNSFHTSNSTITLSEFHMKGIRDGYKYVPKAAEVVPPYYIEHYIPERNMRLSVITDVLLFAQANSEGESSSSDDSSSSE